jgi:division/cell wall cluster transcriptional repressor MraZ
MIANMNYHPMANVAKAPEEQERSGSPYYGGSHQRGVDMKLRVRLPVKWRTDSIGPRLTICLTIWPRSLQGMCLRVYPPEKMAEFTGALNVFTRSHTKNSILNGIIRKEFATSKLDPEGRICLPKDMVEAAGIRKKVLLCGMLDSFEIWNPELFESLVVLF